MKKQLPIALLVITVLCTLLMMPKSYAYPGGLLDGKDLNKPTVPSTRDHIFEPFETTKNVTDNNQDTNITLKPNEFIWYDFPETMNISSFQLKANASEFYIVFYGFEPGTDKINTGGISQRLTDFSGANIESRVPLKEIKRVLLKNTGINNAIVTEFDVFGTPSSGNVPNPDPNPDPEPKPQPSGDRAILTITMTNRLEKEFDLSMDEVNSFINWYDAKDAGTGPSKYAIDKHNNNKGPFNKRTDYVIFNNILSFEVNEYSSSNK